jgi:hypothetical protein
MTNFIKKLLITVGVVGAIVAGVLRWVDTPGIAKENKKEIAVTKNQVQQVAGTLDKYITEQRAIQKEEEKSQKEKDKAEAEYKKLLHKLIEAVSKK